jgi:predicted permease
MLRTISRVFRRNPLISILGIIILGIGVGSCLSVYSLLNTVFSSSLPGVEPGKYATIGIRQQSGPLAGLRWPDYEKITTKLSDIEIAACSFPTNVKIEFGVSSVTLQAELVSTNYFQVVGAKLNASLTNEIFDERNSAVHAAVLRSDHARRWFGSDRQALDQVIKINGEPFRIVSIASLPFSGALNPGTSLWLSPSSFVPVFLRPSRLTKSGSDSSSAAAALKSPELWKSANVFYSIAKGNGVVREQQLASHISPLVERELPNINVQVVQGLETDPEHRRTLLTWAQLALALALALFLVAALNFSAFLVAQIPVRLTEMKLRRSLGGTSYHLIVELLRGPAVLLFCASIVGTAIAVSSRGLLLGLSPFFHKEISAAPVPTYGIDSSFTISWQSLMFLILLVASGLLLVGGLPAFELLRVERRGMVQKTQITSSQGTKYLLLVVIALQSALALGSVLSAVFLIKGLIDQENASPGFVKANVEVAKIGTAPDETPIIIKSDTGRFPLAFASETALRDLDSLPGVKTAAFATMIPLSGKPEYLQIPQSSGTPLIIAYNSVTRNYFDALGIRIIQGERFSTDSFAGAPREAVASNALAKSLGTKVGDSLELMTDQSTITVRVTGIADDVKYEGSSHSAMPLLYLPSVGTFFPSSPIFVIRGNISPKIMAEIIRKSFENSISGLTVSDAFFLQTAYDRNLRDDRSRVQVGCAAGVILLILALVGVYGVTAFRVAARRRELAIRICVGAQTGSLIRLVVQEIAYALSAALIITIVTWTAWSMVLFRYIPTISLWNPALWAVGVALWLIFVMSAAIIPSLKVAGIHPAEVLKSE